MHVIDAPRHGASKFMSEIEDAIAPGTALIVQQVFTALSDQQTQSPCASA